MFLPVGDEPNAPETPWATYALIAANVAVWFCFCVPILQEPLRFSTPGAIDYIDSVRRGMGISRLDMIGRSTVFDLFVFEHGYRPSAPSVVSLFTSMFLHGGYMHLAGNMLFLYIFGDNVEARLGRLRYVLTYLACGIVATLSYSWMRAGSPYPLVGASGAISGILGCYFIWFPHNRVRVIYTLFFFIERAKIPARWMLAGYLLVDNVVPLLLPHGASHGGVAHGAHVGGFVAGALLAIYVANSPGAKARPVASQAPRRRRTVSPFEAVRDVFERSRSRRGFAAAPSSQDVLRLIASRQFAEALAMYRALRADERLQLPGEAIFALADAITTEKRFDEALQLLRPLCGPREPDTEVRARSHLRMGLIYLRGSMRPASAYPHLLDALELGAGTPVAQAAQNALQEIEQPPKRDPWSRR